MVPVENGAKPVAETIIVPAVSVMVAPLIITQGTDEFVAEDARRIKT
jgi:hypothetical protein